ncbi:unnamed protein product [Trichogramma brassicae]|uniref:Uncharacterized protein n=1 Tax=Trichogramma brassicae TaxID=86971 RepID=A0A6H5II53_9HYME|nr:unnamed protein product [Trichogramma brassicae]
MRARTVTRRVILTLTRRIKETKLDFKLELSVHEIQSKMNPSKPHSKPPPPQPTPKPTTESHKPPPDALPACDRAQRRPTPPGAAPTRATICPGPAYKTKKTPDQRHKTKTKTHNTQGQQSDTKPPKRATALRRPNTQHQHDPKRTQRTRKRLATLSKTLPDCRFPPQFNTKHKHPTTSSPLAPCSSPQTL